MSPPLSPEQSARVERHTDLVRILAKTIRGRSIALEFEDLVAVGNEALVAAALRYDPAMGASFKTYAHYRVRGAMIDALRAARPAGRRFSRAQARLEQCQEMLERAEREDRLREGKTRQTMENRVAHARELLRQAAMISVMSESEGASVERLHQSGPDPEQSLLDQETRDRARELIDDLEPTEQRLLIAIYHTGQSMSEYAAQKGTSPSTISRRHSRIIARLSRWARGLR